ncbi:MAG: hypothetical protein ACR2MW_12355 [Chthoniobacterales bacterium]
MRVALFIAACFIVAPLPARAVILDRTGDPAANTSAPTGSLANSGWQFEGIWGGFLGTPIAPHFFLSAKHIGNAGGSVFTFGALNYSVVRGFADPNSDLNLWQVTETFPTFAPLYTQSDEVGKLTVVLGRGTQRGSDRLVNGALAGWNWGAGDGVQRWGTNLVSALASLGPDDDFIYGLFDHNGLTEEATLSSGDSGGAAFIEDGGVWKLAGIHYAVDGPFYTDANGNGGFNAALFDARGLYVADEAHPGQYVLVSGSAPVPAGFYPTRISSKLAWIYSVTDSLGDLDRDGLTNLLEYGLHAQPLVPDVAKLPQVALEGSDLTLIYTKVTTASDIQYLVEQSTDLTSWTAATATNEIVATNANVQTIKAKVARNSNAQLFLRLRITRP